MGTTIHTLTVAQIRELRHDAAEAGDVATVRDCERALLGRRDGAARRRIVQTIRRAEREAEHERYAAELRPTWAVCGPDSVTCTADHTRADALRIAQQHADRYGAPWYIYDRSAEPQSPQEVAPRGRP